MSNTTMKRRRRLYGQICLLVFGLTLVSLGLITLVYQDEIYDFILNTALTFNPTSTAFKAWRTNDPPLRLDLYLYNWTNSEDIHNSSIKPRFEQVGPYVFKEVKEKVNITWDEDSVSYLTKKSYYFDEENSVRNLSDMITTVNAVSLSVAYKARHLGYFSKRAISMALSSISSLSVTKTAGEILFYGYQESILSVLSALPINVQDKFGLFYGRNGTVGSDGLFTMHTKNDEKFGEIVKWNNSTKSRYYSGQCNDIHGSAGEFYPLHRKREKLVLYSPELCKHADLEYEHDVVIKGIKGYKYSAKNIFDNGTTRPQNKCFCTGECIPSGVFNVSECRQGSPSFLSMPHFYNADPYYTDLIDSPVATEDDEFYVTMEPKSGIIMDVAAKMQLNFLLQPVEAIRLFRDVPKIYIPIFYFDQVVKLSDDLAGSLRLIQNLPDYLFYAGLIVIGLGVVCLAWSVCSLCCCSTTFKYKQKYDTKTNTQKHEIVPLQPTVVA